MQVFFLLAFVIVLIVVVVLLSKSKSTGFINPQFDMQSSMKPAYVGNVSDEPSNETNLLENSADYESANSNSSWQSPIMALMLFRRFLGVLVASGVLILLNPIGDETDFWRIIFGIILGLIAGVYLNPGNIFSVPFKQYIKWYRLYARGQARQVISFDGEPGWQTDKKLPGLRYIVVALNDVAFFNYTEVPSDAVWYLHSRIGENLVSGRKTAKVMDSLKPYEDPGLFKEKNGQLNIQRNILTPGYIGPIDLVAFEVDDGNLINSSKKDYYKPYSIPDNKFAMVTCLDSGFQLPAKSTFARLGDYDDIEKIIIPKFGKKEVDLTSTDIGTIVEFPPIDDPLLINEYKDIFRFPIIEERKVAGLSLDALLAGPPIEVEDYQNIIEFDKLKGSLGPHWRLIRPGRLININRFVFDITLVEPFVVETGTAEVMILSTGVLARDVTQKGFRGGRIVREGGNGINIKALEPAQYAIPTGPLITDPKDSTRRHGRLVDFVTVPTRQLSLYFKTGMSNSIYDTDLKTIEELSKDAIKVTYDFNVLLTIPVEAASVIVAAFGSPMGFITQVIGTIVYGETVEFIRMHTIEEIITDQHQMMEDILLKMRDVVQSLYGVQVHRIKMEHFDAPEYMDTRKRIATAQATEKAIVAETKVADEDKKLQASKGQAIAIFKEAVAKGDAAAVELALGAIVKSFGKDEAVLIQALKEMTSGKHPFVPGVLGYSGENNGASGFMPIAALIAGFLEKMKSGSLGNSNEIETVHTIKTDKVKTTEVESAKKVENKTADEKKEESKNDSEKK